MSDVKTYDELKGGSYAEHYRVEQRCANCGHDNTYYLPLGVPKEGQAAKCGRCGCSVAFRSYASNFR